MTDKILQATNLSGILKVRLTDDFIAIRFSPDNPDGIEISLVIAVDRESASLDHIVPVV